MDRNEKSIKKGILVRPFVSTDINFVITKQLKLYEAEYGLKSQIWRNYLINGVRDLVDQFDRQKDCIYILEYNGVSMGCAAIEHIDDITAKFRFFFVDIKLRGKGAGHLLLDKTIDFCKGKKYKNVHLWTFSTLYTARHLYQTKGFKIIDTHKNIDWGTLVLEELWELKF